jgi:choline dehydrogenase-like flavoprotein
VIDTDSNTQRPSPSASIEIALRNTTPTVLREAHEAIVVGAGAAGGLAAALLTEAGLRVLVLEAGPQPDSFIATDQSAKERQPVQSRCWAWSLAPHLFVDDVKCPYVTPSDHPFFWIRGRQLGGRMVIPGHGRQYYRFAPHDFEPIDHHKPTWPLKAAELDRWYADVEQRLRMCGCYDNIPWLPDSRLSELLMLTEPEAALRDDIRVRWPLARCIVGRSAAPLNFLETAASTGRLSLRTDAIVREIEVDPLGRVTGVVWIDAHSRMPARARAPIVFLCASALESTRLLLLSQSGRNPDGLGASSGVLGRFLMDHIYVHAEGRGPPRPLPDFVEGRCLYLPRFDAREQGIPRSPCGFGIQVYQLPHDGEASWFSATAFGEMLPQFANHIRLDSSRCDAWDLPVLHIDCAHRQAEQALARQAALALKELAALARIQLTSIDESPNPPGLSIHECGTARMGLDPASSVLDAYNQCWDARGLYVPDAASFPSQGAQNPTLTILALTARACDHAVRGRLLSN